MPRLAKHLCFCKLWNFWSTDLAEKDAYITPNFKLCQIGENQIIKLNAFFFFISTGATLYYHATYIAFSYFELFTEYEDDIF